MHRAMPGAIVEQTIESQELWPSAVTLIHRVWKARIVFAQTSEESDDRVVFVVNRIGGKQSPILGVQDEHQPQQAGQETAVNVLWILFEGFPQQFALCGLIGRLKAPQ